MAEPVIVATSRTPIGRASKGSLVDARPDDMSAFIVKDVLSKVDGLDPAEVEDIISALVNLGYSRSEVFSVVMKIKNDSSPNNVSKNFTVSQIVPIALKELSGGIE